MFLLNLPSSLTTGKADTLLSTKIIRASWTDADSWTVAICLKVPMATSPICFWRNLGLGIIEPWKGGEGGKSWYQKAQASLRPGQHSPSYKDVEELEDSFMSEDVEDVPRDGVDDRQPMDLILQQGVDGIKQTEKTRLVIEVRALAQKTFNDNGQDFFRACLSTAMMQHRF